MPVIPHKKTVDVDSYGFFAGFGANEIVLPTDQFEGWPSLLAKRQSQSYMAQAIRAADTAIYGAKSQAPGLAPFFAASEQENIRGAIDSLVAQWELMKVTLWEAANRGTITADGVTRSIKPREMETLLLLTSKQISLMQEAIGIAKETTYSALVAKGAKALLEQIVSTIKLGVDTVITAINEILKTAKSNIEKAGWLARNWIWIGLGGIAVFYVLPTLTKTARAYRGGGFDAGSAALEEELRGARQAASDAASKAAALARKAGVAYTTGNPATLMAGMKRRRARRHR